LLNASLLYTVQEHGDSSDPAAAAAAIAAENASRGETKVGARHTSIEEFDVQELMSTTPEVNARFRVGWATEFQGMTLDDLTELSVLGQGTFKIEKLKCSKLYHYNSCNYRQNYFLDLIFLLMSFIES
jgi:hypothetical protein